MTSCAWLWLYFGSFLMLAELLSPGFVIFFFGLSAVTVGGLRFIFGDSFTAVWQLAAFSGFAIVYLLFLRRWLKHVFGGVSETSKSDFEHETVGRSGKVTVAIRPPLDGRVMIGDSEWTASAACEIPAGADVRVTAQRNLTMTVEPVCAG